MRTYWIAFQLALQNEQAYRLDLFLRILKYAFAIVFLAVVWGAIGRSNPSNPNLQPGFLLPYYLASALLFGLSNFHTWYIEEDIKLGYLSKYLLKPVSPFLMYGASQAASCFLDFAVKFVILMPALLFFQTSWPSLGHVVLLIAFLPVVYFFSFSFFFVFSSLTFWFSEIYALRWGWFGIYRFISGVWVPLTLFPVFWQRVSFYLPFSHLLFTPIQLLQNRIDVATGLRGLGILLCWTVAVTLLRIIVWRRGILAYENTGV